MEESVKRKERLQAMRSEAALTGVPNVETSVVPSHLSNPLVETASVQGDLRAAPRFDFYTDPMATFSDNRKRGKVDGQGGQPFAVPPYASGWPRSQHSQSFPVPRNYEMNPRPVYQMQNNYSQDNRVFPAQSPYRSSRPLPVHQGTPGARNEYRVKANYNNYAPDGSLQGLIRPPFNYPGPPRPWHGAMDAGGYSSPPNPPTDGNFPSPNPRPPGPPDFSHGPPMSRFGNITIPAPVYRGSNPGSGFGRGRGRGYMGTGRGGRQGPGFYRPNMASDGAPEPKRFFDASMLQDPWLHMEPVVWKRQDTNPSSSNSWLPLSIRKEKEGVPETFNQASSQPSLAEYLAASFNKAVEDSPAGSGS